MAGYVVYDMLQGNDAAHHRKVRVEKHVSLEEAKRSAQMRFIRLARGPKSGGADSVECITVETTHGEIVYEVPQPA